MKDTIDEVEKIGGWVYSFNTNTLKRVGNNDTQEITEAKTKLNEHKNLLSSQKDKKNSLENEQKRIVNANESINNNIKLKENRIDELNKDKNECKTKWGENDTNSGLGNEEIIKLESEISQLKSKLEIDNTLDQIAECDRQIKEITQKISELDLILDGLNKVTLNLGSNFYKTLNDKLRSNSDNMNKFKIIFNENNISVNKCIYVSIGALTSTINETKEI
jgi:chromosome segregation ATPase